MNVHLYLQVVIEKSGSKQKITLYKETVWPYIPNTGDEVGLNDRIRGRIFKRTLEEAGGAFSHTDVTIDAFDVVDEELVFFLIQKNGWSRKN